MASRIAEKLAAKKAAIYIRVSTHWQVDKDSLKVQRRELIAYVTLVLGITDYVVFEDPGYSAKNTDRPEYQAMMDRVRTGEFTHLVVWKIDRISRNLIDFAAMHDELQSLGVTFVSKNEQFDTSSAIGEAMMRIILIFAELERKTTAERVTAVMLSRASDGQWNGGRVPFGYSWSKEAKTFSIVPEEAKAIRRMAELYEQYQSLLYVAKYLNDAGIVTKTGGQWTPTTVRTILTNPWYIGQYVYNVHSDGKGIEKRDSDEWITVENHHEPILNEDVFYRMKFLLTRNKRGGIRQEEHPRLCWPAPLRPVRLQHDGQPRPAASERLPPLPIRLWQPAAQRNLLHQQVHLRYHARPVRPELRRQHHQGLQELL